MVRWAGSYWESGPLDIVHADQIIMAPIMISMQSPTRVVSLLHPNSSSPSPSLSQCYGAFNEKWRHQRMELSLVEMYVNFHSTYPYLEPLLELPTCTLILITGASPGSHSSWVCWNGCGTQEKKGGYLKMFIGTYRNSFWSYCAYEL